MSLKNVVTLIDEFLSAVGMSTTANQKLWAQLRVGVFRVTSDNSLRKNGGDDGTRTRNLLRDREVRGFHLVTSDELRGARNSARCAAACRIIEVPRLSGC
jgi:hypothetical protein